jgi:hypothetical protein
MTPPEAEKAASGLPCGSITREPPTGSAVKGPPLGAFSGKAVMLPAPRRLRRDGAGRSPYYSAAAADSAKITPGQIAEAQRMAREWKPTKQRRT